MGGEGMCWGGDIRWPKLRRMVQGSELHVAAAASSCSCYPRPFSAVVRRFAVASIYFCRSIFQFRRLTAVTATILWARLIYQYIYIYIYVYIYIYIYIYICLFKHFKNKKISNIEWGGKTGRSRLDILSVWKHYLLRLWNTQKIRDFVTRTASPTW